MITLIDGNSNALFAVTLEIRPSRRRGGYNGPTASPYYDGCSGEPVIYAQLAQGANALTGGTYISIVDAGTIQIQVKKSVMQTLRGGETYDVFLTIADTANDDARQILIGRLPVFVGGRNT